MPLYDYFCEKCGKSFEIIQKMDEKDPLCEIHNISMKKEISKISVRRGGGLYSIDTPSIEKMKSTKDFE